MTANWKSRPRASARSVAAGFLGRETHGLEPVPDRWDVLDGVNASGSTPFAACTVNVEAPADVDVPDNTPAVDSVKPAGNDPDATVKVGAGFPDAVNVKL